MKKARILVVDNNKKSSEHIKSLLYSYELLTTLTTNGNDALKKIETERFNLVISDIRIPGVNGIELLHRIKTISPQTPFILLTSVPDIFKVIEGQENKIENIISKPFDDKTLIEIIKKILDPLKPKQNKISTSILEMEYFSLSLNIFYFEHFNFPIYIKLSEDKFVTLAKSSRDLNSSRLDHYRSKSIKELFISEDSFLSHISLKIKEFENLQSQNSCPEKKNELFNRIKLHIHNLDLFNSFVDTSYESIHKNLIIFIKIILNDQEILNLLESLINSNEKLFSHSYITAILSLVIAKGVGIESIEETLILIVSALFHEIGLKEISNESLKKERIYYSDKDESIFINHPQLGFNITSKIKSCPKTVSEIIYQHHEYVDGSGFPKKLKKDKISPFSMIICLASDTSKILKKKVKKNKKEGFDWISAINSLQKNKEKYNSEMLNSLKGQVSSFN